MLTHVRFFSFFKYVFTRRLFFMQIRKAFAFAPLLNFLTCAGFIFMRSLLNFVLVFVLHFATRPVINHIRLFLRRSNRVFINSVALRRLFFLCPSSLWLTVIDGKPKPILFNNLVMPTYPIFGYLS